MAPKFCQLIVSNGNHWNRNATLSGSGLGKMARQAKGSTPPAEDPQEQMTVVILQLKGSAGTLQKGFEAINNALSGLVQPAHTGATFNGAPRKRIAAPQNGIQEPEVQDEDEIEEISEEPAAPDAADRQRAAAARKYTVPTFLDSLDLTAGTGWTAFAAEKKPQNDYDKYLVAALWLTEAAGLDTFTTDHIFTCFRAANWKQQRDFSQPLRQMKLKKSYFDSPSRGVWKLTAGAGLPAAKQISGQE
jgi:hypothetical protein